MWLVANIKQSDAARVHVGQALEFRVSAIPGRVFSGKIDYVAETLDTTTRRLLVRATIRNPEKLLKLEMFASVTVFAGEDQLSPAVPRESIIYEGSDARVWIATDDSMLEQRKVTLGLTSGNLVQVVKGLEPGDKVVTKGALFIDRAQRQRLTQTLSKVDGRQLDRRRNSAPVESWLVHCKNGTKSIA